MKNAAPRAGHTNYQVRERRGARMLLSGIVVLDATDRFGWLAGRALADLGADVFKIDPPDTDRSRPEWRAFNINKRVVDVDPLAVAGNAWIDVLLRSADICLVTPHSFDAGGQLDPDRLHERYPQLIVVSITPFGRLGPRGRWRATDLEVMAAGGAMALAGEPEGMPLRVSEPQSYGWASAHAAAGAMVALHAREKSGRGDVVEVSAQASVVAALAHAPTFVDMLGIEPTRAGAFITGRSIHGARYRVFWPCKDGWLNFIFYGGRAGRRTNEQLVAWMRQCGAELGPLAGIDWARFDPTKANQAEVDALEAPVAIFFATISKREFLEQTHQREMLGYPVSTVADIAGDPQLKARGYFQTFPRANGGTETFCGSFAVIDGKRPPLIPPPFAGEGGARVPDAVQRSSRCSADPGSPKTALLVPDGPASVVRHEACPGLRAGECRTTRGTHERAQALGQLNVACFGGFGAGPAIGKVLANFGARVVHVESKKHPDGFRLQYPPFAGNRPGLNRGGCFSYFNDSKYGVSIDLENPQGVELAGRLISWCDIVIENMRPGVMKRLGLSFEALMATSPHLVILSTCNMGQTGPRADQPGFGSQLSALAGFCGLTGFPDAPPMLLYGPYIDFIASTLGTCAVLAAAFAARRGGRGTHIDLSQYECGLTFMAGTLQDFFDHGVVRNRCGNDDPQAAPHGAFPCADGEWVTLSCWSDAEFTALARVLGAPRLAADGRFATAAARRVNAGALGAIISGSTKARRAADVAELLQAAGIASYPVVTIAGLFADPQLFARGTWRIRRHPEIGDQAYCFPGFDLRSMPGDIVSAAPCLGADNDYVFRELVGVSETDMKRYAESGVFG